MKLLLSLLALSIVSTSFAATREGWLDNLEKAKEQARTENKKILLDFTGSDWCGWCKKLDAEVFNQQEWKEYAAKNLVLVEVDFPRGFQLPADVKKQNDALQAKYKIEGFPTIVVLSAAGTKKGEVGYVPGGPQAFIKELEGAERGRPARR